jgi:hypothetical protein
MTLSRWRRVLAMAAASLLLGACQHTAPPPAPGYFGDTLTLPELIARINANNDKLPTLWAREKFNATIVDPVKKKATDIDGYGNLLFTGPNSMRLTAQNELADLFEMGSDPARMWLWEKHDQIFWWGNDADIGEAESAQIPIRPDMVLEILGIRPVNTFLLLQPAPVLRFNNAADAYMVDWQVQLEDHWAALKEIWYDRQTQLPKRVLLFDAKGRVVLWARLSNWATVRDDSEPKEQWPWMATRYELYFPYTGTTLSFELSDMTLSHKGFPNSASYRMPDLTTLRDSGVKVIQIDEDGGH